MKLYDKGVHNEDGCEEDNGYYKALAKVVVTTITACGLICAVALATRFVIAILF